MPIDNNQRVKEIVGLYSESCGDLNRAVDFALTRAQGQLAKLHVTHNDVQEMKRLLSVQADGAMRLLALGDFSAADPEEFAETAMRLKFGFEALKSATSLWRIASKALVSWFCNGLDEGDASAKKSAERWEDVLARPNARERREA